MCRDDYIIISQKPISNQNEFAHPDWPKMRQINMETDSVPCVWSDSMRVWIISTLYGYVWCSIDWGMIDQEKSSGSLSHKLWLTTLLERWRRNSEIMEVLRAWSLGWRCVVYESKKTTTSVTHPRFRLLCKHHCGVIFLSYLLCTVHRFSTGQSFSWPMVPGSFVRKKLAE